MAFTDDKYYLEFKDARDRLHNVFLWPDGYSGSGTELEGAATPLVFNYGSERADGFTPLAPTWLDIAYVTSTTTVYDELVAATPMSWLVTWTIGGSGTGAHDGTEVWRGYILTDELAHEWDIPHIVQLTAVDGLSLLRNIEWDPANETTRAPMIEVLADALGELTGHGYGFGSAGNWHAYFGGAAVSGNSWARYEVQPSAWRNPDTLEYGPVSLACSDIAQVFAGQLTQAQGKWRLTQYEFIDGASYTQQTYDSNGTAVSTESITDYELDTTEAPILADTFTSTARPYSEVTVSYQHGPDAGYAIKNQWFRNWAGAANAAPDDWTEMDEHGSPGGPPDPGSIIYRSTDYASRTATGTVEYSCGIHDYAISEATWTAAAPDYADLNQVGIKQASAQDYETGWRIGVEIQARLERGAGSLTPVTRPIYWSLWVVGASFDYYWNAALRDWVQVTSGTINTPPAASKNKINLTSSLEETKWYTGIDLTDSFDDHSISDSGPITIKVYGPINASGWTGYGGYSDGITGALIDHCFVWIDTGDLSHRGVTLTRADDGSPVGRPQYPEIITYIGEGPTLHSERRITNPDDTLATDWKASGYPANPDTGWEASGESLELVHAEQVLKYVGRVRNRMRANFRITSGTEDYWQHRPMLMDSAWWVCTQLSHDVRECQYSGEFVQRYIQLTLSGTPVEEWSDWYFDPGDWICGTPDVNGESSTNPKPPNDEPKQYYAPGDGTSIPGIIAGPTSVTGDNVRFFDVTIDGTLTMGAGEINVGSNTVVIDSDGINIASTSGTAYGTAAALFFSTTARMFALTPGSGQATYDLAIISDSPSTTTAYTQISAQDTGGSSTLLLGSDGTLTHDGSALQVQDAFLDDIAALTDPNADRFLVWDDSAGAVAFGSGIEYRTSLSASNYEGNTMSFTAGEAVTFGDVCYLKSDGKMWMADADAAATASNFLCVALGTISADAAGTFLVRGVVNDLGGIGGGNPGDPVYVSVTAGAATTTAPSGTGDIVRVIGHRINSGGTCYFNPSGSWAEVA